MRSLLLVGGVLLLLLAGCRHDVLPNPGDACTGGGYLCLNSTVASECRLDTWVALPCRGPDGCQTDGGTVACDMTNAQQGDSCASSAEGRALCAGAGSAVIQCNNGAFVVVNSCSACTVQGGEVTCTP